MGLPPLLVDTYRRYKKETAAFVQWLASTARATGDVDEVFGIEPTKRQIHTKCGQKCSKRSQKKTSAKSYKISVNSFTHLAHVIADKTGSQVPTYILTMLQNVIEARKGCAAWYRSRQDEESKNTRKHNENHQHIITVLERVYTTLLPLKEKKVSDKTEKKGLCDQVNELSNIFEVLEVEECLAWEDAAETTSSQPRKKPAHDTYEVEASDEDISFALYCFMKDITEIRIFVQKLWKEYTHCQLTLNTVAVTANTAIDVMRRLNEAFVETFPQFEEHTIIIDYLYDGYVDPKSRGGGPTSSKGFGSYEQALVDFYTYDFPDKSRATLLNDMVMKAVSAMRKSKKVCTWAVFAVQIMVDTRRELGAQVGRGLRELQENGQWLNEALEKFLKTGKTNDINHFHRLNDKAIRDLVEHLKKMVFEDIVQEMIVDYFGKEYAKKYDWGPHYLLRNHPTMAGILLQDYLFRFHQLGIQIAGEQGPTRCAIHLAHAATLVDLIPSDCKWADLEYITEKHGDSYVFVGERPKNLAHCFRHISLAFGASATTFSRNQNKDQSKRIDSRAIAKHQDPKSSRQRNRRFNYISQYVQVRLRVEEGTWAVKPTRAAEDPGAMLELLVNKVLNTEDPKCPANPVNEKKTKTVHRMSPLESLTLFKETLKQDDFALRFNFMSLNWRCVNLMRRIQKVCIEQSPRDYPMDPYGVDQGLNGVIHHMLAGFTGVERKDPFRFVEACELLRKVMETEGNVEYSEAERKLGIVSATAVNEKDEFDNPDGEFASLV